MTYDFNQLFAGFQLPGADKFQGLFADAGERSQELAAKSQKAAEELADLAKANVEAIVEAGRIAAAGAKSIGQDVRRSGRDGVEQASDAVKTLAEAKSPTEFFQLQSELARASFDRIVAESSKLTEQRRQARRRSDPAAVEPRQRQCRAHQRAGCLNLSPPRRQAVRRPSPYGAAAFVIGTVPKRCALRRRSARCHILGRT